MGARSISQRIRDCLDCASMPLTAGDIQRRLVGNIERDEVTSRLAGMKRKGEVMAKEVASQANTGPRIINAYFLTERAEEFAETSAEDGTPEILTG